MLHKVSEKQIDKLTTMRKTKTMKVNIERQ